MYTFLFLFIIVVTSTSSSSFTYYISSSQGNDTNDGLSPSTPFQSLYRITPSLTSSLQPGDSILLLQNDIFILNTVWWLTNLQGNASHPITIGTYTTNTTTTTTVNRPLLVRNTSIPSPGPTFTINNSSNILIRGLEISGGEAGIVFTFSATLSPFPPVIYSNFRIEDNYIHNIRGLHPNISNAVWWGHAIALAADNPTGANVTNLTIRSNLFNNSDAVYDNRLLYPGWNHVYVSGMQFTNNTMTYISFNTVYLDYSDYVTLEGNVFLKNTPAFLFTLGTTDIIIDGTAMDWTTTLIGNEIGWRGEYPDGGPDGCGIDFENSSNGITVAYNYIHDTYGAGIMVLGHQLTSHNLNFTRNMMLDNGCNQTRADRGGIAFLQPNSSGTISSNIFTTCNSDVPLFNPSEPSYLDNWTITNDNLIDGVNNTLIYVLPYPTVEKKVDPVTGNLLIYANISSTSIPSMIRASLSSLPLVLRYTTDGSKPTLDSRLFPSNGTLVLSSRTTAVNIKTFLDVPSVSALALPYSIVPMHDAYPVGVYRFVPWATTTTPTKPEATTTILPPVNREEGEEEEEEETRMRIQGTGQIIIVESPTMGGIFSTNTDR